MKKVQTSKKILTPADKTSSMYRLNKNDYQILLRNAFTKTYMKIQIKTLEQKSTNKVSSSQNRQLYQTRLK